MAVEKVLLSKLTSPGFALAGKWAKWNEPRFWIFLAWTRSWTRFTEGHQGASLLHVWWILAVLRVLGKRKEMTSKQQDKLCWRSAENSWGARSCPDQITALCAQVCVWQADFRRSTFEHVFWHRAWKRSKNSQEKHLHLYSQPRQREDALAAKKRVWQVFQGVAQTTPKGKTTELEQRLIADDYSWIYV